MADTDSKAMVQEVDLGPMGDAYVCYKGYYLPPYMEEDRIMDGELDKFELTEDDVMVAGFPKSGSTWLTKILLEMYNDWAVVNVIGRSVVPMLEWTVSQLHTEGAIGMAKKKFIEDPSLSGATRRLIKTHFPYDLLPRTALDESSSSCKKIHLTRNPKDVCTNFYFLERSLLPMTSPEEVMSWEDFVDNFSQGRVVYGPWVSSVAEWWHRGPEENVLHVTYEEIVNTREEVVKTLAEFLGRPLSDSDVKRVVKATDFDSKVYKVGGTEFRRGVVGEWKNHFTAEQSDCFDRRICNKLKANGLGFIFEPYQ